MANTPAEEFILEALDKKVSDVEQIHTLKSKYALKFKRPLFSNVELLEAYRSLMEKEVLPLDKKFWNLLRKRGVRSKSGIASITVITKAYACPGGCIYCPGEPGMPKSYLSNEPAVMRAILSDFSGYRQVRNRLMSLEKAGHNTDKIEIIISGGTFSYYPARYQTSFVKGLFNALNEDKMGNGTLPGAQQENETAKHRCIGLSVETRPDYVTEKEVKLFRLLGATKVELGVQSLDDEILALNNRGHGTAETATAIRLLKDAGFKINCHVMPNLYGSNIEKDLNDFKKLFENPDYRPDWLKIYPCMVVSWSQLEKLYKEGKYRPYTDEELIDLLIKIKLMVPEYVRIARLYRDIPAGSILAGSKISNIRQVIHQKMEQDGLKCRCIRCREIQDEKVVIDDLSLKITEYDASRGKEFFISYDDSKRDKLCSLLRLRFSSYSLEGRKHFIKELDEAAIIREVHTYGEQVKVGEKGNNDSQHIGLGRRMIQKAEEISKKNGFSRIAVISGIGVREYYRKLGYQLEGTYMVKTL